MARRLARVADTGGESGLGSTIRAPRIVIDERGFEVGAVVEYRQYVALLRLVSEHLGRDALPGYWRAALDGCLAVGD